MLIEIEKAKAASRSLPLISDARRNEMLLAVADGLLAAEDKILSANAEDLSRMDRESPLYDRLQLTPARLAGIAGDMRHVASLPSPLGRTLEDKTLANGLRLRRVAVPFGVIGMVFEARPNVAADVFSLCYKSGNACVLKGGKDADASTRAIVDVIHSTLVAHGGDADCCQLLPATHEATAALLSAVGYVDVVIPRGGRRLIDFVRETARVPVIETGAGVVHAYFDKAGDLEIGRRVIANAKMRRVSVCNALDCLLVHRDRVDDLPALLEPMEGKVTFHNSDYGREWMSYDLSVKLVDTLDDALAHIRRYSSGHSECIITADTAAAARFQQEVDAACVYVNAPTSFTDGAQFGLGAEIGISTQKLGPRGPMALEAMTTYKWLINGAGQVRP